MAKRKQIPPKLFLQTWEKLKHKLGGGEVISLEDSKSPLARHLDRRSGIDWLQLLPDGGIRGIASRCQWGWYDSFTVRAEKLLTHAQTELEKRIRDISEGYLYPQITCQSYFDEDGDLIQAAACDTYTLYCTLKRQAEAEALEVQEAGNARFIIARWRDIPNVVIYRRG